MAHMLRDYQERWLADIESAWAGGHRRVLAQMPTGGGKTHSAATLIRRRGRKAVFAADLDTILDDTVARLAAQGLHVGRIQAGHPLDAGAQVQVCSLQTLVRRGVRPAAEDIYIDEAHISKAATYEAVLEAYQSSLTAGLTATPQRGDGRPLDNYDVMVCGPPLSVLLEEGSLVPCHVIGPPTNVRVAWSSPAEALAKHAPGRRAAAVFCRDRAHARVVAGTLPGSALFLGDTKSDERTRLRKALRNGSVRDLVTVDVLVKGFDEPCIDTIVWARQVGVPGVGLQMVGRGLRPNDGKTHCTLLDLHGSVHMIGFPDEVRVWSLTGEACRRPGEQALRVVRCQSCLAMFAPRVVCPRCGESNVYKIRPLPQYYSRADKMARLDAMPQHERDARYLRTLQQTAVLRMGLGTRASEEWAMRKFKSQFDREPVKAA